MIATARAISEHRAAAVATLRATFGVSLYDAGTPRLRWGEAADLLTVATGDSGTYWAAEALALKYPAPMIQILAASFAGAGAGVENVHDLLPFGKREDGTPPPSADEFRDASAAMLAEWGIADDNLEKSVELQARITAN